MADYTLSARITGDASGFEGMVSSAKASLDALQGKVASVGSKIKDFGGSISSAGEKLSNLTKPARLAAAALGGIVIAKGFSRLTAIDTASAKLQGLGHDASSVKEIMNSASASVKGTAFGLGEAATTAAGAVAAGIAPGKELTRYLSLTADTAAIAGTSMSEMGSIINKVQTGQKAYTENLEQLSDRGIPIYQWLGKEAGVAASEVKDMASSGQISSEMFLAAIEKNIGGAAKIMGEKSFTAAVQNIGASLGRIGANFLDGGKQGGGFFSQMKPLMSEFMVALGGIETKAADLGVKFGAAFSSIVSKGRELKASFDKLSQPIQSLVLKGAGIGTAIALGIGPALKIVGKLATNFGSLVTAVSYLFSPIGIVVGLIGGLIVAFNIAMSKSETFRNKVNELTGSFGKALSGVKLLAQGLLTMATKGPGEEMAKLREKFITLFPEQLWTSVMKFGTKIDDTKTIIKGLAGVVTGSIPDVGELGVVLDGILTENGEQKLFNAGQKIREIGESAKKAVEGTKLLAQGFLTMITTSPGEKIGELHDKFTKLFPESLWSGMINFATKINTVVDTVKAFVGVINGSIPDIESLGDTLEGTLSENGETKLFETGSKVREALSTVKDVVIGFGSQIGPIIQTAFSNIGPFIAMAFGSIGSTITGIFNGLKPVFGVLGGIIKEIIPIVQSFVSEIGTKFQTGANGTGSVISSLAMSFMGINPVIKTVLSVFQNFGPQIAQMLQQCAPMIVQLVGSIANGLLDLATTALPIIMGAFKTFMPIIIQVGQIFISALGTILPVILGLINQLVPIVVSLAQSFMQVVAQIMPLVAQLVSALVPVIQTIITTVMNIIVAVAPALMAIIQAIVVIIQAMLPIIGSIINVVITVVTGVIAAVTPILAFVGMIITTVISIITPIISFIAGVITSIVSVIRPIINIISGIFTTVFTVISSVWNRITSITSSVFNTIGAIVSRLSSVFSTVFNAISGIVSSVMNTVSNTISMVFSAIQNSWSGLTGFVNGIFSGISSAVSSLVCQVKSFVNDVIGGVNLAIGIINKIPGVSIGEIPYLQSGTSSFKGGFARMNEGGRGEMVLLPSGSQVIPHDASMKYAKEAAKQNSFVSDTYSNSINEGDIIINIQSFENNSDRDIEDLSRDLAFLTYKERGRLQNG